MKALSPITSTFTRNLGFKSKLFSSSLFSNNNPNQSHQFYSFSANVNFLFNLLLIFSLIANSCFTNAYYYNEEGEVESDGDSSTNVDDGSFGSSSVARSLYTRSVKSLPPLSNRRSYTPPSPSRARLSAPPPPPASSPVFPATKSNYQQPASQPRFEQQTYEQQPQQQSYAPQIQHDVVSVMFKMYVWLLV